MSEISALMDQTPVAWPASPLQQRLWAAARMNPSDPYGITSALHVRGPLDRDALIHALETVQARHHLLRSLFREDNGLTFTVMESTEAPLIEWHGKDLESCRQFLQEQTAERFDYERTQLWRAYLCRVGWDEHVFAIHIHHLIADIWSLNILEDEILSSYKAFAAGRTAPPLPVVPQPFPQLREIGADGSSFWADALAGAKALSFGGTRDGTATRDRKAGQIELTFDPLVVGTFKDLAIETGVSLFNALQALVKVLLFRYSGESDITIVSPVSRRRPEEGSSIGLFLDMLPLRDLLEPASCFRALLEDANRTFHDAYVHRDSIPAASLGEISNILVGLQNVPQTRSSLPGFSIAAFPLQEAFAKGDLTLQFAPVDDTLFLVVTFASGRFESWFVQQMSEHLSRLMELVTADPEMPLTELPILNRAERRQLAGWSGAMVAYPRESPVAALFSEQARLEPGATAVRFGADSMTYAQLEARAASLARHLRGLGVKDGEPVLLAMERSPWMIVAMLAVLGAGGAYVPLNPGDPEQRLRHILAETRASILLTTSETMLPELDASTLLLDTLQLEFAASPWIQAQTSGSDPAYIMFTSGSTGQPKGVVVPHRAITRLVRNTNFCRLTAGMRVAQVSSPAFDAATFEIWGALLNGATLHLTGREELLDPDRFLGSLRVGEVDVLFLTTALFNRFAALDPGCFRGLDYLLFGGEAVDPRSVRAVLSGGAPRHLLHVYGPTESTTFSTFHQVESVEGGTVPIGLPIANTQVWVVDGNGREQPLGVPGEIVIGGDGLALGYLHQPELTAEKFVTLAELGRVYTSGDIGRRRADGAIEFLGRRDHQIKLRGFRIEPGEIEAALRRLPGVREAVVDVRGQDEHRYLAAWVEARGLTPDQMLDQLRLQLPGFLIPARILMLDTLPLNVNGKVDRRGLPEPSAVCLVEEQAPVGAAERRLAGLWSEVLGVGVEAVGRGSHFFALGGNSLVAIQLISRVRESFSAAAPLRLIFDAPRLGEQAAALDALSAPAEEAIARLAPGEPLPLSFAQERLWFLDQMGAEGGAAAYAIHAALWLEGGIEEQRLRQALFTLTERQASLRMNFFAEHGVARLRLRPAYDPLLREELGTDGMDVEASIREHAARHAALAFDLAHDALFRITLVGVAEDRAALLFSMHHIIGDGWSLGLLVRELGALYAGQRLAPLPIAYPDFAAWQRRRLAGQELERLLGFWRGQLEGAPELLELPADHARPAVKSYRGGQIGQHIPSQLTAELAALGAATGATLFMTLLAAFAVLLHRLSGQTDLVIGSPVAERQARATEAIVGLFVNTIALRVRLDPALCWRDLLAQVRTVALDAYAHQEMPFEKLVDEIQPRRSLSHSPLFQVALALQSTPAGPLQLGETRVRPIDCAGVSAKFDLLLNLELRDGALEGVWEYSADLFEAATIERLAGRFEHLLQTLVRNPDQSIATLDLLPEAERRQLAGWSGAMVAYPRESPVAALFSEQARLEPGATAVRFGADSMTYAQLEARAASLARHLRGLGVKDGEPVLLAMERSPWMIVAMLAVLGAGGAYVPLNPGDPEQRLRHILAETRASILLTTSETMLPELDASTLLLDTLQLEFAASPWIQAQTSGSDPAYIMFTSGSTGQPKGVVVPHRAITRLVRNTNFCRFTPADVFLQFAPAAFDAATFEIWGPLLNGATLVLSPPGALASDLPHLIAAYQVTTLWLTAGLFHLVVDHFLHGLRGLHTLLAGGDVLSPDHVRRALRALPGCTLVNGYGPTENTTFTTCFPMQDPDALQQPIPIGFPIPNTRVWVLDDHNREQPIGVPGEIVIGGDGLALGYLHQPQFTAEKFLTLDEFGRVYKSGDIGRFRPDGALEFLGRSDNQIKLRGYRIEPGEIEAALRQIPQVQDAAVDLRGHDEHRYLAAWVAAKGITPDQMLDQLRLQLPAFLIPANITVLDTLPINHNGKIDKQKLHTTSTTPATQQDIPLTHTETQLATIWKQILKIPHIQKNQNFFSLGGDSILAIRIVAHAREAGLQFRVADLLRYQTIAELTPHVSKSEAPERRQPQNGELVPLTPIQHWFFRRKLPEPWHFNQAVLLRPLRSLTITTLRHLLDGIVNLHPAFRFRFMQRDGVVLQTYASATGSITLDEEDLRVLPEAERQAALEKRIDYWQRSLDIENGPLSRVVLFHLQDQQRLFWVTHHLIVDGVSWRILLADFEAAVMAQSSTASTVLQQPPATFGEFSSALDAYAASPQFREDLAWWPSRIEGSLPFDDPDGEPTLDSSTDWLVTLPQEETRTLLEETRAAFGATPHELLLTAVALALAELSGNPSVLIDVEGHGRSAPGSLLDFSRTVGWFTVIYPLPLQLDITQGLTETLKAVKEAVRTVPSEGLAYGIAVASGVRPQHHANAAFNYLGQFDQTFQGSTLEFAPESAGETHSRLGLRSHALNFDSVIWKGQLRLSVGYSQAQFRAATILALAERVLDQLRAIIHLCTQRGQAGYTPSDFPLALLSQSTLNGLAARHGRNIETIYPATPMQQGLFFDNALSAGADPAYYEQLTTRFEGDLDPSKVRTAWKVLLSAHGILRSSIIQDDRGPRMLILREVNLPWTETDWRHSPLGLTGELAAYLAEDKCQDLDVAQAPLLRLHLARVEHRAWQFTFSFHHALLDGWSLSILFRQFIQLIGNHHQELSAAPQFESYAEWLAGRDASEACRFWTEALEDLAAPTVLPAVRTLQPAIPGSANALFALTPVLTHSLQTYSKEHYLTLNTLLQAAWALLLHSHSNESDVVFGVTVSGRDIDLRGIDKMVGLFINTVPLRVRVESEKTIRDWLLNLQEIQRASAAHAFYGLPAIRQSSGVAPHEPLFHTLFVYENYFMGEAVEGDQQSNFRITEVAMHDRTGFSLTVTASLDQTFRFRFGYDRSRYDAAAVESLFEQLTHLLEALCKNDPSSLLRDLPLVPQNQLARLRSFSVTDPTGESGTTNHLTLLDRFEAAAKLHQGRLALTFEDQTITYGELEERANILAWELAPLGAKPGRIVAIIAGPGFDLIVGLIAILKTGAAYLPIDPATPVARIRFMLEDADVAVVLTDRDLPEILEARPHVSVSAKSSPPHTTVQLPERPSTEDIVYVIYTSGSTGVPKAVMVTHANVVRLFSTTQSMLRFSSDDVWTLFHSAAFDFSVWEIWGALLYGGRLVIVPAPIRRDHQAFSNLLLRERVTILNQTPSAFRQLIPAAARPGANTFLRFVFFGGEALNLPSIKPWFDVFPDTAPQLINMYGITETTVHVTWKFIRTGDTSSAASLIGRPLPDLSVVLLNQWQQVVPARAVAEMYVAGPGVARGYLNQSELTAKRFVELDLCGTRRRYYRSGDLARWTEGGELEYLGRADHQVKLRGYRIELGEIEACLALYPKVTESIVLTIGSGADCALAAYVGGGADIEPGQLQRWVAEHLPPYMVPTHFVVLDHLPLTINGKIDRRALPEPRLDGAQANRRDPPADALEERIATIWSHALQHTNFGVTCNLYAVGGHSLTAMQIVTRTGDEFGLSFPMSLFLREPTVRSLAQVVRSRGTSPRSPVLHGAPQSDYPLTYEQLQLWLEEQKGEATGFNMTETLHLDRPLDATVLGEAIARLCARHSALRTRFFMAEGVPRQMIVPHVEPPLHIYDPCTDPNIAFTAEAATRFSLDMAPLFRVGLVSASHQSSMCITMHHTIGDGLSLQILTQDMAALYEEVLDAKSGTLAPLPLSYGDYALWQTSRNFDRERQYWQKALAGAPPTLRFDAHSTSRAEPERKTGLASASLPVEVLDGLREVAASASTSLSNIVLALYALLIFELTGQGDFCISSAFSNRPQRELEAVIGLFVNVLPIRVRIDDDTEAHHLLEQLRHRVHEALDHVTYPFHLLVSELLPPDSGGSVPFLDAVYVFEADKDKVHTSPVDSTLCDGSALPQFARYPLCLSVHDRGGSGVRLDLFFDRTRFPTGFAARAMDLLQQAAATFSTLPNMEEAP